MGPPGTKGYDPVGTKWHLVLYVALRVSQTDLSLLSSYGPLIHVSWMPPWSVLRTLQNREITSVTNRMVFGMNCNDNDIVTEQEHSD